MFSSRSSVFDRSLEKATSQLLMEPDWDSILQICDAIRQEDVTGKYAVGAIKKKVGNDNPHVALFALQVLESIVKNCGSDVHDAIATKEFMEWWRETTQKKNDPVKAKMCELIQVWAHAFRNESGYKIVGDNFSLMRSEGYQFPQLRESDAMFMAEKAPEWKDGENCHRCRTAFTTFNRKHHCRNCGQVFCGKCSSKTSIIPRFGIEREVRVCDSCFDQLAKGAAAGGPAGGKEDELPSEYLNSPLSKQKQTPQEKSEEEIREEEELQLAIAMSQSEADAKEKEKKRLTSNYALYGSATAPGSKASQPAAQPAVAPSLDTSDMDPELARYLNRNYWQNKAEDTKVSTTQPSAPIASSEPIATMANSEQRVEEKYQNGDSEAPAPTDNTEFLQAIRSSIQIFVNRMKSDHSRGRSIANDSAVQGLFMTISQMHPQLMSCVQEQEELRTHYENLQDKLAKLKDAREALDVLREEHNEKRRREQEEANRLRQIQMAQKLEVLRQKKMEYLEYQRQMHLQRMQQQEHEMRMRLEQERSMVQQRTMSYNPYMQSYNPQTGSAEGSPMHMMHGAPYGGAPPPPHDMAAPPGAPGAGGAPPPHHMGGPPPQQHMGGPPSQHGPPQQQHMGGPPQGQEQYMGGPPQGQQQHMGGGGMPPQQGPNMGHGGPGGMGGPGGEMGGPPSMGASQMGMGGPPTSQHQMGGPNQQMGGPNPPMGGPGQNMGGPMQGQMGVGGPPQGMPGQPHGMGGPPTQPYGPPQGQQQTSGYPPQPQQGGGGSGPPGGYAPQGYHPGQPYNNQQGMQGSMPPGQPPMGGGGHPQGHHPPPQGQPPQQQQYMGGPPPPPPQQQYQQGAPPPQQQQEAPGQPEAQLISFD